MPSQREHVRSLRHAALGDPARLAIVDALLVSDRMPSELGALVKAPSNLLAHHLDTLESAGLIIRTRSSGDARRRYVRVINDALPDFTHRLRVVGQPALFVCTQNSARSQLAAALWAEITGATSMSAGTRPAVKVHPLAASAARRAGLDLSGANPRTLASISRRPALVITVCDQVHEELDAEPTWLHWSEPDPVADGHSAAFDACIRSLRLRIRTLVGTVAA